MDVSSDCKKDNNYKCARINQHKVICDSFGHVLSKGAHGPGQPESKPSFSPHICSVLGMWAIPRPIFFFFEGGAVGVGGGPAFR